MYVALVVFLYKIPRMNSKAITTFSIKANTKALSLIGYNLISIIVTSRRRKQIS